MVTVNNPPVNALSLGVPEAIEATICRAAAEDSAKAVVITGGGKNFHCGGRH